MSAWRQVTRRALNKKEDLFRNGREEAAQRTPSDSGVPGIPSCRPDNGTHPSIQKLLTNGTSDTNELEMKKKDIEGDRPKQPYRLVGFVMIACGILTARTTFAEAFNVTTFGAKGDGITLDTIAIQSAIDRCADSGGGEVRLEAGRYLTGSLRLRSGVRFHLDPQATLLGSTSMDDYKRGPLLSAEDAKDIVIEGGGEIDAQGESFWQYEKPYTGPPWRGTAQFEYRALRRPRCLHFIRCENLALHDVTIRNSPSWTVHLQRCAAVKIERITIRNPLHGPNTDGIDINSCRDVTVDSCDIITGDDGIVLKSTEPGRDHPSSGITVSHCRIMSACNALKIGTETHADFENIVFRDCELYCSTNRPLDRALSGVAIESVDGSNLRNIRVENITMSNLRAPFFVRLGHRGGNSRGTRQIEPRVPGTIRDVVIRNVQAKGMMFESSITGIPGHPVEGIVLEKINMSYEGGGTNELVEADVPDREIIAKYPEAQMFGRLPAYGLYARHVNGLTIRDVRIALENPDARAAIVFDDVAASSLERVTADAAKTNEPLFSFVNVRDITVRNCVAASGATLLMRAIGEPSARKEIRLEGNTVSAPAKEIEFQTPQEALDRFPLFHESAPGIVAIEPAKMSLTMPMHAETNEVPPGGTGIVVSLDGGRDRGTARARFEITETGRYVVRVHALAPSGDADSFHLAINDKPPCLTDLRTHGQWAWDFVRDRTDSATKLRTRSEFSLEAGVHLLTIRNREPGTRLGSLAIVRLDRLQDFESKLKASKAKP